MTETAEEDEEDEAVGASEPAGAAEAAGAAGVAVAAGCGPARVRLTGPGPADGDRRHDARGHEQHDAGHGEHHGGPCGPSRRMPAWNPDDDVPRATGYPAGQTWWYG